MPDPEDPLQALHSEGDLNCSPQRAAWASGHIDPETASLLDEDARYFLHQSLSTPCLNVLKACRGPELTDFQGRTLLDFHGNNVHQVGFAHPKVIEAITKQLHDLSFCPRRYTNAPAIALAKRLAELAPGDLRRVLFAPAGSLAIGMAIKLARTATGRFKTISMWDSFHGASLDAISIGGEALFRKGIGPLLPGCEHVPPPNPSHCPFRCGKSCNLSCADYVEYVLEKEGDVAAVIAETVRCTPFIPPRDYWQRIRAACDRHGALLILDEIPTGLGRTGRLFAVEHFGIAPDMLVLGKGLGGGVFPLAALLAKDSLNEVMKNYALGHYTHEKSPVGCAAGLATLDIIQEEDLLRRSSELGTYALDRLRAMIPHHPLMADARGLGLLIGVELAELGRGAQHAAEQAERVMHSCLARGLNFKVTMGNILTLTPALTIQRSQMDHALSILEAAIEEVESRA